ncbi:MAG: hypothetical protein ACI9VR_004993, partial [Cognaticolwellia sp.]
MSDQELKDLRAQLAQVKRERSLLEAAVRASPALMLIATLPDGHIEYRNDAVVGGRRPGQDPLTALEFN